MKTAAAFLCLLLVLPGCMVGPDHAGKMQFVGFDSIPSRLLGVEIGEPDVATASSFGVKVARTTVVTDVAEGSSAERAGVRKGDVIYAMDDSPEATPWSVRWHLRDHWCEGGKIRLFILRHGEQRALELYVPVRYHEDVPRPG